MQIIEDNSTTINSVNAIWKSQYYLYAHTFKTHFALTIVISL